jgi:4-diphosphocytidyl-2-C-methyl-D-erythritol kinase
MPRLPGKTGRLYARLNSSYYTDGQITTDMIDEIKKRKFAPSTLFNAFENVVFTPGSELSIHRAHLSKLGVDNVHLAGSGPTLFTMLENKIRAEELYARIRKQGIETYLTETLSATE